MSRLVDFFRAKGLAALKQEDQCEVWYQDWIEYQAAHGIYASLLSPPRSSPRGHRFDLRRWTRALEVFAYFAPSHAYSLHVSFLGLFPILQSDNEPLKQEAVKLLEAGGLFAFGVSERAHGSDLLATEFTLQVDEAGQLHAAGSKYYIGNADTADLVSVFAKRPAAADGPARRAPLVFFALRPQDTPAYEMVRKIRTMGVRSAFIAEFKVADQVIPAADVISENRDAWEAVFGTVDFGRFFLGFGAVGICERAFAEAVDHLRRRSLYGKPVTDMPHIRRMVTDAFARLVGMKLYACRALDYVQAAGPDERRYLLFNAVQKARVSTEGVKALTLLSECIGARGFEADTFFETALREVPMIPGLEGSTHINFRLTTQFLDNYFADSPDRPPAPESVTLAAADPPENPYWFGRHDRHAKTVGFDTYLAAYQPLRGVANVRVFVKQVEAFHDLVVGDAKPADLVGDAAMSVAMGRCFSVVVYGQLVAENCVAAGVDPSTVSTIFHELVRDLAAEALHFMSDLPAGTATRDALKAIVRVPRTDAADLEAVFAFLSTRYG